MTTVEQAVAEGREDELPQTLDRARWVRFEPSREADRSYDPLGRPFRDRPDRYGGMVLANPAALGTALVPRAAGLSRALMAEMASGRFGSSVDAPPQLSGGHFESGNVLAQQEQISAQAEQVQHQAASDHYRAQVPGWR